MYFVTSLIISLNISILFKMSINDLIEKMFMNIKLLYDYKIFLSIKELIKKKYHLNFFIKELSK